VRYSKRDNVEKEEPIVASHRRNRNKRQGNGTQAAETPTQSEQEVNTTAEKKHLVLLLVFHQLAIEQGLIGG
jgi:hypothetical protein